MASILEHTQARTRPITQREIRALGHIWRKLVVDDCERLDRVFWDDDRNWRQTVYVYRVTTTGTVLKPYLIKVCGMFQGTDDVLDYLRDELRGGDFRILIRDGAKMVFSGEITVIRPGEMRRFSAR